MDDAPQDLGSATPTDAPGYQTRPFNPEKARESVRGNIAIALIALLAATILASFALLWLHPDRYKDVHDWLDVIFNPLVALVGAATGYYFGSQSSAKSNKLE
jgi:hypothetical protein